MHIGYKMYHRADSKGLKEKMVSLGVFDRIGDWPAKFSCGNQRLSPEPDASV